MNMLKTSFLFFGIMLILIGCNSETNLEKLKNKKAQLKAEIADLDIKIQEIDTIKTENFPLVILGKVGMKPFEHKIAVQGTIETDQNVLVNSEMNGVIQQINVKEGQEVKKGQILAVIDSEILNSNILELKSQLDFAEYTLQTQKQLFEKGLGTEFEYKQVINQVDALKAKLNTLEKQKNKTVITAPFSGVIDQLFPKEGELTGPQQPLLRIVNNQKVSVTADISERHYRNIAIGSKVDVYVPTLTDTFQLKIATIGNFIHPTNRTFRVRADIEKNEKLLPNMLAQLIITDLSIDSALVVPSDAIMKSQMNEDYVFIATQQNEVYEVKQINVNILSNYNGESAISANESIRKGDLIVIKGGRGISAGDIVKTLKD